MKPEKYYFFTKFRSAFFEAVPGLRPIIEQEVERGVYAYVRKLGLTPIDEAHAEVHVRSQWSDDFTRDQGMAIARIRAVAIPIPF